MSRALWLLVLMSAFLVAGARCLSALLSLDVGTPAAALSATQGTSSSSHDDDFATSVADDDDSDDSADALLAPESAAPEVAVAAEQELQKLSFTGQDLALSSHTRSLDRPPRA